MFTDQLLFCSRLTDWATDVRLSPPQENSYKIPPLPVVSSIFLSCQVEVKTSQSSSEMRWIVVIAAVLGASVLAAPTVQVGFLLFLFFYYLYPIPSVKLYGSFK